MTTPPVLPPDPAATPSEAAPAAQAGSPTVGPAEGAKAATTPQSQNSRLGRSRTRRSQKVRSTVRKVVQWGTVPLFAPIILALVAFGLDQYRQLQQQNQQFQTDRVTAAQRLEDAREASMNSYIDTMSNFLLDSKRPLDRTKPGDEVRTVARVKTLDVLLRLDGPRKGHVLLFLYEANLMETSSPIVSLSHTDLSGVRLTNAHLSGADLSGADLSGADLSGADLRNTDLSMANLTDAHLNGANLTYANLTGAHINGANLAYAHFGRAHLTYAHLSGANLTGADFLVADLSYADLTYAQLSEADLNNADLKGALLEGARLEGARLEGAALVDSFGLTKDQIALAKVDGSTQLPAYLKSP